MDSSILGFKSKSSYYENTKIFLENGKPVWVSVWVESDDDKRLWLPFLKERYAKYKFKFKCAALHKAKDEKVSDGCSRLFYLINQGEIELGKENIACIDSDFSYISGNLSCKNKELLSSPFVFQTYVHSKENVYIHACGVSLILERALGEDIEQHGVFITKFTDSLSVSLYDAVVKLVALYRINDINAFDVFHKKFNDILSELFQEIKIPDVFSIDISEKTSQAFAGFKNEIKEYLSKEHSEDVIEDTRKHFHSLSVNKESTISFIRGHNIYPLLMRFYKDIDNYVFKKKRERYLAEHIPKPLQRRKLTELSNKRVGVENVICSRGDVCDVPFFRNVIAELDVVFNKE
ncbi:DUF4435 domain-containing protein [Serratia fonticola]|uniref:DUF4435 domain-containing protein n=1 Tax=Serratia fonticola TaxID=47917 RepID=UPI00217BEE76|nr:DUF4435 domain-containing protein [Serratia fonticola]CAI0953783.1 Uncharacterised protein [Serratia fonticola]CAI1086656.1 Uncharacterised protein [Serratia fonticola]